MAKQLRNLDIGFNPSMDYDSHSCTPLKASIQFFSTALFILLISLTLGAYRKTLWNSACHTLLPAKSDFKNALSLLPYFASFFFSFALTTFEQCIIIHLFRLLSVFCHYYVNSTKVGHSLGYFCQWELCLVCSRSSTSNWWMKNEWVNFMVVGCGYNFCHQLLYEPGTNTQPYWRRWVVSVTGIIESLMKHQILFPEKCMYSLKHICKKFQRFTQGPL